MPQRAELERMQRRTAIAGGLARRARLVLLRADGLSVCAIAQRVGISRRFVYKWVQRFQARGLAGLDEHPNKRGRRRQVQPTETP